MRESPKWALIFKRIKYNFAFEANERDDRKRSSISGIHNNCQKKRRRIRDGSVILILALRLSPSPFFNSGITHHATKERKKM